MGWALRVVWVAAAVTVITALIGFFTIPAEVLVPRQFDLNGWSSYSSRNVTLGLFIFGALLGAAALNLAIALYPLKWLPPFAVVVMLLLAVTALRAIVWASTVASVRVAA